MKYGRKPVVHTERRRLARAVLGAHLDSLGAPWPATNWRAAVRAQHGYDWGMYGNDSYSDCVFADTAHQVMVRTANAGTIVVPTDQDVLSYYSAVTGFQPGPPPINEEGTVINAALAYLKKYGFAGSRMDNHAPIDYTNIDHIKWSIALFGAVRLGIMVGPDLEQAFEDRQPWTTFLGGQDGHDICLVDYDANYVYACTWGRDDQAISWSLLTDPRFCDEAHAELWFDWIRQQDSKSPSGIDTKGLEYDLSIVGPEAAANLPWVATDHGAIVGAEHGQPRSPHWATVEHEFKKANPVCAMGGRGPVQVHHCFPFHYVKDPMIGRPDLELDERNLIGLTEGPNEADDGEYHLLIGHRGNFREGNLNVRQDAKRFYGRSCASLKANPDYQAIVPMKPLTAMSDDEKRALKAQINAELPFDPTGTVANRFGFAYDNDTGCVMKVT